MLASALVYAGLVLTLTGSVAAIRPPRFLGVAGRWPGGIVLASGLILGLAGLSLPAPEERSAGPATRLDDVIPAFQFNEVHDIRIQASAPRVYQALRAVTPDEIRLFRTLTWIRSPRWPWAKKREGVLAPPAGKPILDVFLRSGFILLADEPGREFVMGTVVCCGPSGVTDARSFADLSRPGFAKAAVNFLLEDEGGGFTRLRTETRVHATDATARRRFAVYWRVIYPGSALIRRSWLHAVKARAEG